MPKTVNELNTLWVEAGHTVEDLNEQINNALNDDNFSAEAFEALKNQRDTAKVRRDALKEQMVEAQAAQVAAMDKEDIQPLNEEEMVIKNDFIKDFKNMIRGNISEIKNMVSSKEGDEAGNGGLTIPKDIQTAIRTLVRQYDSLQEYVTVESVSTASGSRVIEKMSEVTALAEIDEDGAKIGDNDDPQLTTIKYVIKRFAGINTVTNSLLKDTAENIMAWLSKWIAKKVVVTRNKKIIEAFDLLPTKATVANWDDIIDLEAKLDPALKPSSIFLTNTSGFTALKKVKNALGDYLMEKDVKSPTGYSISGFPVKEIADRWLPNAGTKKPLYFGDFKEAIILFDREHISLLSTNIGGGAFETDTSKIRVIDRFDVQKADDLAVVAGSFTAIADQEGTLKTKA